MPAKTLILIPTYNEKENVTLLCEQLVALNLPDTDIVFADDNSPDGTGQIIKNLTERYANVKGLHRPSKMGIGSAHADGIQWAYDQGYERLLTMDCDFTHPPADIPAMLAASEKAEVVVASRYMQKNSLEEWNLLRKTLTITGHFLTRRLLKMPYDATGAFRVYQLRRIPRSAFQIVSSKGYSFFFESLFVLNFNRFSIAEVPIKLPARTYGHSKMRMRDAWQSVQFLLSIYLNTLTNEEKFFIDDPFIPDIKNASMTDVDWDIYWKNQKQTSRLLYDAVAAFYRKFIIRGLLNRYTSKYFRSGSQVLHAGCGSGQVDKDVRDHVAITAMDISVNALSFYRKVNHNRCVLLHGSIFEIPLADASMDGVYNLGVMEHFTEDEIQRIFSEFRRVIKQDGRIVILWPPEFGLSVIFFKILTFLYHRVLGKKDVKFHPDEITRVQSKAQVTRMFEKAQFRVIDYYFGPRDLFTYSVIVAEKA